MGAQHNLNRLRFEDPTAAAAVIDALWEALAREEPRMFAALWRRANLPSRRPAAPAPLIPVQWIDEVPPLDVVPVRFPSVNLSPVRTDDQLVVQPAPTLAELLPSGAPVSR